MTLLAQAPASHATEWSQPPLAAPGDYHGLLAGHGLAPVLRGVWSMVGGTSRHYGWKLHLSSVQVEAARLIAVVAPLLGRRGVAFKAARDEHILGMLNEGALGATQVGKFMTIYPADDVEALDLTAALVAATAGFSGPAIVTDLWLGSIVHARYGPFSPPSRRDRLGLYVEADPDHPKAGYTVPFALPDGIDNPFAATLPPQPEPPSRQVGPIGPGYLVVDALQHHAKGSVLKAIDLRSQRDVGLVVLKEGRPRCLCDVHGRDMGDRLANQARAHRALADTVAVPAAQPLFEHRGSVYLPLDFVEGRDFGALPATPFYRLSPAAQTSLLGELRSVVATIARLHEAGYVHRDLSMRNIRITEAGEAVLIDLEISHRLGDPAPPFTQGTAGFVSPQQLANETPATADDIFALGAVMICATTGMDPQRVLHARTGDRPAQLRALGMPAPLAAIAGLCIDEDAARRPTIAAIAATLDALAGGAVAAVQDDPAPDYRIATRGGLRWLIDGAPRDESGMWQSPDLDSGEHASLKLVHGYRTYRSTNRGVAGVVYLIAKLHRFGFDVPGGRERVAQAVDWLLAHHGTPDDQLPGLHFGEAGVAVAIAEAIAAGLIERGPWTPLYMAEALAGPLDWPDLTHGAAGQGLAAMACAELLGEPDLVRHADRCVDYLIGTQAADGSWVLPDGVAAMSHGTYTGYAHGVAGMAAFLAAYARGTGDNNAAQAAERAGAWLSAEANSGGSMSLWWPMRIGEADAWRWWCHGGPGIALAFLALHALTGDARHAATARAALRVHPRDPRYPNMTQCHGLSGLGDIYLEAHRALGEDEWHDRAEAVARLLANLARNGDGGGDGQCNWLAENPYQPTPDLMIGSGGIMHFLARMALGNPHDFRFALLPVGA
jgi:hypothetical protein